MAETGDGGCATVTCSQLQIGRENLVVGMGGSDSKLNFRKAVVQLTTKKTVRKIMKLYFQMSSLNFLTASFE